MRTQIDAKLLLARAVGLCQRIDETRHDSSHLARIPNTVCWWARDWTVANHVFHSLKDLDDYKASECSVTRPANGH